MSKTKKGFRKKKMKCIMKKDFAKRNDREDVSPFLSVFLYFPAILSICLCPCMSVLHIYNTVGPMGAGRSPLGLLLLPFHSRFLGLNAKAKKRRKNTTKKEYLPTVQFYVFCIDVRSNTLCLIF